LRSPASLTEEGKKAMATFILDTLVKTPQVIALKLLQVLKNEDLKFGTVLMTIDGAIPRIIGAMEQEPKKMVGILRELSKYHADQMGDVVDPLVDALLLASDIREDVLETLVNLAAPHINRVSGRMNVDMLASIIKTAPSQNSLRLLTILVRDFGHFKIDLKDVVKLLDKDPLKTLAADALVAMVSQDESLSPSLGPAACKIISFSSFMTARTLQSLCKEAMKHQSALEEAALSEEKEQGSNMAERFKLLEKQAEEDRSNKLKAMQEVESLRRELEQSRVALRKKQQYVDKKSFKSDKKSFNVDVNVDVKADLLKLRADNKDLRQEVSGLRQQVKQLEGAVEELEHERDGYAKVNAAVSAQRDQLQVKIIEDIRVARERDAAREAQFATIQKAIAMIRDVL
jgi:hypothetical protein